MLPRLGFFFWLACLSMCLSELVEWWLKAYKLITRIIRLVGSEGISIDTIGVELYLLKMFFFKYFNDHQSGIE